MRTEVPPKQTAFLAASCKKIVEQILDDLGVDAHIDHECILDLTEFFLRDIYRIDKQQRGSVSLAKLAGYWAFWIRKLKPISDAKPAHASSFDTDEIGTINELVAVHFSLELVIAHRRNGAFQDHVKDECDKIRSGTCDGVACVKKYADKYLNFKDEFFLKYIVYSMRHRTFGPHHFALLMENLIFSACDGIQVGN